MEYLNPIFSYILIRYLKNIPRLEKCMQKEITADRAYSALIIFLKYALTIVPEVLLWKIVNRKVRSGAKIKILTTTSLVIFAARIGSLLYLIYFALLAN